MVRKVQSYRVVYHFEMDRLLAIDVGKCEHRFSPIVSPVGGVLFSAEFSRLHWETLVVKSPSVFGKVRDRLRT